MPTFAVCVNNNEALCRANVSKSVSLCRMCSLGFTSYIIVRLAARCRPTHVSFPAPAQLGLIQSKELTITGSIGSPGVWEETIRFMATKNIDLSPLVTARFSVEDALGAVEAAQHPMSNIKAHIELNATL